MVRMSPFVKVSNRKPKKEAVPDMSVVSEKLPRIEWLGTSQGIPILQRRGRTAASGGMG